MLADTIPAIFWFFIFDKDADWAHWTLYVFSMGSVIGPMLLNFFPLALALFNYVIGWKSGYLVDWNRRWEFWVIYFSFIIWNTLCIAYVVFMAPSVQIWYFTKDFDVEKLVLEN